MKSKIKKDLINNSFLDDSLTNVISSGFAKYAKYIIQDRALPDVRDGLKPVQRRILYAMYGLNLYPNSNFKKSARIVGEVIGKYHPHGDSSIYEALIRMAQEWKVNLPLVDIHGNKGSIDDDPPAAMRYTETKLTKFGFELLNGIQKKIVPFIYNFDDSEYEPVILPGIVPNLLVNGAIGIAAGYATDIPPHNLNEVIDFLIAKIKNPNLTLDKVFKYLKGPDFPTGGIIKGKNGIYSAFEQGQGKIEIQSKYEFVFDKKPLIIINEIPYGVIKSKLIFELNYLVNKNKLVNISRIYDASDRQTGLKIIIELKDQKDSQDIIDFLMSKSSLSVYYHYNSVVISQGKPIKMGILDIANAYLNHQNIVLKTKINYDLDKANKRLEIIEGLIKVKNDLFKIINAIVKVKGSKIKVIELLKNSFNFTQNQAEAIAQLQLYRLSATDQITFEKEEKQLKYDIQEYKSLLSDQKIFDNYLIKHLKNIKKEFNCPRKSKIIDQEIEIKKLNVEKIIQANDVVIAISKLGYIKKFGTKYFKNQDLSSYLLKNEDRLIYLETIKNSSFLFLFTNYGHYFCIPAHKIKENKWKDIGSHINNFSILKDEEVLIKAISIENFNSNLFIYSITNFARVKKIKLLDFFTKRIMPIIYFKLNTNEVISSLTINNDNDSDQIAIFTKKNLALRFSIKNIPLLGLKNKGKTCIKLEKKDNVSHILIANENNTIILISDNGGFKKMKFSDVLLSKFNHYGQPYFAKYKNVNILDVQILENVKNCLYYVNNLAFLKNLNEITLSNYKSGLKKITSPIDKVSILVNNHFNEKEVIDNKLENYLKKSPSNSPKNLKNRNLKQISLINIVEKSKIKK